MIDDRIISSLENEIYDSEPYRIYNRLKVLTFSFKVFEGNYYQLNELLITIIEPKVYFEWGITGKRKEFEAVMLEVSRCLQNYLMSALALVAHTRNHIKKYYSDTPLFARYELRAKNDFSEGLHQFIQDLRNYTVHDLLLLPSTRAQFEADNEEQKGKIEIFIVLEKSRLNRYGNWSPKAKKYIDNLDENINLINLTNEYFTLVTDFHLWMHSTLDEYHKNDSDWLERKYHELEVFRSN